MTTELYLEYSYCTFTFVLFELLEIFDFLLLFTLMNFYRTLIDQCNIVAVYLLLVSIHAKNILVFFFFFL